MDIKPIRTKRDYRAALTLVEAIKFRMEQSGLGAKDLVTMIGQLWRLHREPRIPAESLIEQAERRQAA
jgi:antitoxin component HigA of HigAB toxin-antitoxin module